MSQSMPARVEVGCRIGPCQLDQMLGQGGFSMVYTASNMDFGGVEAVKVIRKETLSSVGDVANLSREIQVLKHMDHEGIISLRGVVHGPAHMCLRLEMAGSRTLYHVLKKAGGGLDGGVVCNFQGQLACAIEHVHERGYVHRDLKPENVAITPDGLKVKILDFGSAVAIDSPCDDMAGTMPFMAPEVLAAEDTDPYDPAVCDIWSSGVMLLEMLCGTGKLNRMLKWSPSPEPTAARQAELTAFFARDEALVDALRADLGKVPEGLLEMLRGMLRVDQESRLVASEVVRCDWLQLAMESDDE